MGAILTNTNDSEVLKGKPCKYKGVKEKTVKCPYCEKTGGNKAMKRWHFDNCKKHKTL